MAYTYKDMLEALKNPLSNSEEGNDYSPKEIWRMISEGKSWKEMGFDSENELTSVYKVDIRQLGITNYTLKSEDNSIDLEGNYTKFELLENVAVPFNIEVMNKAQNQELKISYKNIDANARGITLKFELPDDAEIIEW